MTNNLPINFVVANQLKQVNLAKKINTEEKSVKQDLDLVRNKLAHYLKH